MHLTQIFAAIAPLAAALGSPIAPTDANAQNGTKYSDVFGYSGIECSGRIEHINNGGGSGCYRVKNKMSIIQFGVNPCWVSTWSGNNCRGSRYDVIPNSTHCLNVPYASVLLEC
ncbi:hypothetical protein OQA88_1175 [Cercophora sp. LCS_1]